MAEPQKKSERGVIGRDPRFWDDAGQGLPVTDPERTRKGDVGWDGLQEFKPVPPTEQAPFKNLRSK